MTTPSRSTAIPRSATHPGHGQVYADGKPALAADGKPYTTLVFGSGGRPNADADSKTNPEDGNKAWIAPALAAARRSEQRQYL